VIKKKAEDALLQLIECLIFRDERAIESYLTYQLELYRDYAMHREQRRYRYKRAYTRNICLASVDRCYIEIFTRNLIGVSAQAHVARIKHGIIENDGC